MPPSTKFDISSISTVQKAIEATQKLEAKKEALLEMSDDIIDDSCRTAFNDKIAGLESDIKSITKLVISGTLPLGSSATTAPNQSMITSSVIHAPLRFFKVPRIEPARNRQFHRSR